MVKEEMKEEEESESQKEKKVKVEQEEESESSRVGITGMKSRPRPVAPPNRLSIIRLIMLETIC